MLENDCGHGGLNRPRFSMHSGKSIDFITAEELSCFQILVLWGVQFADAVSLVWGTEAPRLSGLSLKSRQAAQNAVDFYSKEQECLKKFDLVGAKIYKLLAEISYWEFQISSMEDVVEAKA